MHRFATIAAASVAAWSGTVFAQEAIFTQAATMPAPGAVVVRERVSYSRYGSDPTSSSTHLDLQESWTGVQVGLARALSLDVDASLDNAWQSRDDGTSNSSFFVRDASALLKYRFYQDDTSGIDTFRIVALGGVAATFQDRATLDPEIGVAATWVKGRHGFNQDVLFRLNTGGSESNNLGGEGPSDALRFDSAYLFRLAPETYASDTEGAWYVTAEMNGLYETSGDIDLRFSPGLLYEGRSFAVELFAQVPLYQQVDHRAELDFTVGVGVRLLF
ncbi:MAG: hypothetical protein WC718_05925 [Phycisphaerales bacterium]|jgi:hypothetical protein